ncbi:SDR family NAD(P)-dependent oxidoreductase, partial [Nocardia gamkensis]|uniref:SDR family NAD(P)-dependent oxidoreductase n=1 Tax=Nocardia gamkensis TaxID=352869 RepID=UPI0036E52430
MAQLQGKVAFITGAARGQGRAHAVRLAADGADIIALDICQNIETMDYPNATPDELEETAALVRNQGGRILTRHVDVRDGEAVDDFLAQGVREFSGLDIVIANAGITRISESAEPRQLFRDIIDVNLVGVWNTVQAAVPALIDGGRGGSVVITSSTAGLKGVVSDRAGAQAYTASKR